MLTVQGILCLGGQKESMRIDGLAPRHRLLSCFAWAMLAGSLTVADDQPSPPVPTVETPRGLDDESTAQRLRRMEEMNQALRQQFQVLAKQNARIAEQNETLARQVQELSKRLDQAN